LIFEKCKFVILYIGFLVSFSNLVLAEQTAFDRELHEIQNISDINLALNELRTLEQEKYLTAAEQAEVQHSRALIYFSHEDYENSLDAFQRLNVYALENNLDEKSALSHKFIGINYYYTGRPQKAINSYIESAKFFTEEKTPIKHANLLNNIALCYSIMGRSFEALDHYKKAETLYIQVGTITDQVDVRANIGEVYMRLERYGAAIDILSDVIAKRIVLKDDEGVASAYSALGVSYRGAKEYSKAIEYVTKALEYYQITKNNYKVANQFQNLAEIYGELNQPKLVEKYAKEGIELATLTENKYALAGGLYNYASALFSWGRVNEALTLLERSQSYSVEMDYQQQIIDNIALFSLVYAYQKDTSKALLAQKKYVKEHYKRSNEQINKQLNQFESQQLKEKVKNLEHKSVLQKLKTQKDNQQLSLIIVVVLFILVSAFYFYRRSKDRESKEQLANKIKTRTHELETLTQELELANEVKSKFLANMSHEIRTPLTAVIGQSEAIISGEVEGEHIPDEVGIIHANSLHVLDLINNILDLSKIEANKLELDPHYQDLHVIFIELVNMFAEQAKSKSLTFTINHRLPIPFIINIDALRLKQVLINLCSNALKFTHKGGVVLSISVTEQYLQFKVSDTGIGMSDTQLNDIFNSFTQGDSSISRRFGGSGLGLTLSEQLATLMGGDILVESELNKGSSFTLSLPCSYSFGVDQTFEMKEVIDNPFSEFKNKCSGQVILADDHLDNLRLISRILSTLGLDVLSAVNGKEAVDLYVNNSPKLILMDIQMPEMDGIEAFNVLKQKGCNVPILALTANAMSHEVDEYLALGFDGHLKKPIERTVFINTIVKYCCDSIVSEQTKEDAANVDSSDLVAQFRSNLALEQQDIILHLNNQDYEKLGQLAHRIAGAGQMFGFSALSEKAIAVEYAVKNKFTNIHDFTQYLLNEIDSVLW
jgi:signal transduction histidine kinase/CheY-like chemotaxis protein